MSDSAFWFVWHMGGRAPQHRHGSLRSAVNEAERLARSNPGEQFIVLQSICARVVDGMQKIDLTPQGDDDIPFDWTNY